MPEPQYPTTEGLWSKGLRQEPNFSKVRLETPYAKAVENFRKAIEGRADFDPAVLFVWGTMQGKALLNTLKAVEETFGEQGQAVVRKAVNSAGHEALKEMLENSSFPDDCDDIELVSFIVTGLNCVLYASLERPWITSDDRCEFDILWCPHQDIYTAFDCRVQRYFVEGMLDAIRDLGKPSVTAAVEKLIPRGADCCHFVVDLLRGGEEQNPWHRYSDELAQKALKKLDK